MRHGDQLVPELTPVQSRLHVRCYCLLIDLLEIAETGWRLH